MPHKISIFDMQVDELLDELTNVTVTYAVSSRGSKGMSTGVDQVMRIRACQGAIRALVERVDPPLRVGTRVRATMVVEHAPLLGRDGIDCAVGEPIPEGKECEVKRVHYRGEGQWFLEFDDKRHSHAEYPVEGFEMVVSTQLQDA